MTGRLKNLKMNPDGTETLTVTIHADFREAYDELYDKDINIEIKKLSGKRSLEANAYFWALCGQIARKSSKYSTDGKNDVYREAIKAKGEYEPLLIRKDALERFLFRWSEKGTGWFAEVMDEYKSEYSIVHAYYGSSTYDSATMSKIIDYVVNIANDLGIPTMTEKEKQKMLTMWDQKYQKKHGEQDEVNYTNE